MDWEQRLSTLWASIDKLSEQDFLSRMGGIRVRHPLDHRGAPPADSDVKRQMLPQRSG